MRLAEDPARAVAGLNDQFHFLTATQSANIIAMEQTGDKAGAAAIAIDALGEVMHRRAQQAKEDGPWFATAFEKWKAGASNIGAGLGEILTLGGHQTIIDQYTTAVKRYDEAVKQLDNDRANGRTGLAHDLNVSTA
jgi:phage-related minor tail protein